MQPLTIGELWAVAISLRIVLVENLRRLAIEIDHRRVAQEAADVLANRLTGVEDQIAAAAALAEHQREQFSDAFFVQLIQRLRDQDPRTTPAVGWVDGRLKRAGTNADELVRRDA